MGLLWDGVRVLTRLVGKLQALRPDLTLPFVNHTRRARRRMQEIHRLTPTQRQDQQVLCLRLQRPITPDYVSLRAASGPGRRPTAGAPAAAGRSC